MLFRHHAQPGVDYMKLPFFGIESDGTYRQRFFVAAKALYRSLTYIIFCSVIGCSWAITALAKSSAVGTPTFTLAPILTAYGVAAFAFTVFLYAFTKVLILGLCAYAEWLCEDARRNTEASASDILKSAEHNEHIRAAE